MFDCFVRYHILQNYSVHFLVVDIYVCDVEHVVRPLC